MKNSEDGGEGLARSRLLANPWLLPFYWALSKGPASVADVARMLGVGRRLASTGLYYMIRVGLARRDEGKYVLSSRASITVKRKGRFFAAILGGTVIVAKVRGRSVKAYTVPLGDVKDPPEKGRRGYRARIARYILDSEV